MKENQYKVFYNRYFVLYHKQHNAKKTANKEDTTPYHDVRQCCISRLVQSEICGYNGG